MNWRKIREMEAQITIQEDPEGVVVEEEMDPEIQVKTLELSQLIKSMLRLAELSMKALSITRNKSFGKDPLQ